MTMHISRRSLGALALAGATAAAGRSLAADQPRAEEVAALRAFAERTHPNGPAARFDAEWIRRADGLARAADGMSEAQYTIGVMHLLSWFADGHTSLYVPELKAPVWALRLPFGRAVFADGIYVTSAKDEALPLMGAHITRVGGAPIDEVARRFANVFPAAGDVYKHRWSFLLVSSPGFLHGFGLLDGPADKSIEIEGQTPSGKTVSCLVRPRADGVTGRTPIPRAKSSVEAYAVARFGDVGDPLEGGRNFVWADRKDGNVYVSLDRMGDDDFKRPFADFDAEFTSALKSHGAGRLIIDLRRNGGGDNNLCEPLRKRLQRSPFNRPGGLFVLTAPHTFSAAQDLANRLERETFAVFVGEPTGASPNQCGDGTSFANAGGGLPAQVSTLRWMNSAPTDRRTTLMPDVMAASEFADFIAGRDRAFDAALAHIDTRAFDDAILTAPWERPSQGAGWSPFWATHHTTA